MESQSQQAAVIVSTINIRFLPQHLKQSSYNQLDQDDVTDDDDDSDDDDASDGTG